VCLSEFLPAPGSETDWDGEGHADQYDEWIELYNNLDRDVDLVGWALDDAAASGSHPHVFPLGTVLGAGEYRAFFWRTTAVTLNNEGDAVRLLAPNGEVVEGATYPATDYDVAYSRGRPCDGEWVMNWQPTPGGPNVFASATPSPTPPGTPAATSTRKPTGAPTATSTAKTTGVATATSTPKSTWTPTATSTPKPTGTPTLTQRPTATPTATLTPSCMATPTASPTATDTPTATPTALIPCSVCLSEFLPAPGSEVDWDGDGRADQYDEWIELYNNLDRDVDLVGWALDDAAASGSHPHVFPLGTVLGAGEYRAFFWRTTAVTLNNEGDSVRLLAPNGEAMESATYKATEYDVGYSRARPCSGPWVMNWLPTPGEANLLLTCRPPCGEGWFTYLPLVRR